MELELGQIKMDKSHVRRATLLVITTCQSERVGHEQPTTHMNTSVGSC